MANKNKKYKRSIEDAGRILDEDKYTSYITTGGAGYVPQNNIDINSRLYNNLSPIGYEDLSRVPKAIFLNKPDIYHNKMKYMPVLDEIYAQYLGIPEENRHFNKRLEKSKYKPTQGGENVTYYKLPQKTVDGRTILGDDHRYSGSSNTFVDTMVFDATYMNPGENKQQLNTELGYYTVGRGRDNKGDYVSYYDKWDINPFSGRLQNNTVLPTNIRKMLKDINLDFGVPVNIYDRIHFDDYYGVKGGDRGGHYLPEVIITNERKKHKNGGVHYKVKKGDTLSKIAKQYTGNALRYDEIAKLSNIKNPDRLEIGQDIIIPQKFLDTIKDTNLPELVVTGNKNNKLINKDPNLKHEEKPNTLRVQRLRNRSISLEELNKPSFIESKLQDVKDVINESGNIQDFLQTAWNGIAKNFVEDKQVTTKKRNIKANKNKSKDSTVLDENFAKETRNGIDTLTWDKVPIDRTGNKYYIQESYPITENMRFGARNRGEYTPLNSNNAPLTTYRPLVKYENNKTGAVDGEGHQNHFYGFDKEGKFKVGPLSKFGPGDTMTQAFYFDVVKVKRDKNGNIVYKEDRNNPGRFQPVVEGYDENTYDKNGKLQRGAYKESTITTMSKKRSLDGSYGNVSGGRVLLKCDNETRVVSGSIEHVIQELELMQKNHKGKPVRYYQLDNGSYNRGLRTRNGKNISEQDLRDYDKQNTTSAGGGHFMYIRN